MLLLFYTKSFLVAKKRNKIDFEVSNDYGLWLQKPATFDSKDLIITKSNRIYINKIMLAQS